MLIAQNNLTEVAKRMGFLDINTLRKFVEFWWFPKILPEQSPLLRKITYAPLLVLAITALFYERKRIRELVPLVIPLLAFTLLYSITFVLPRYRVPIQPLLFIFSAYGFIVILDAIMSRIRPKTHMNVRIPESACYQTDIELKELKDDTT